MKIAGFLTGFFHEIFLQISGFFENLGFFEKVRNFLKIAGFLTGFFHGIFCKSRDFLQISGFF